MEQKFIVKREREMQYTSDRNISGTYVITGDVQAMQSFLMNIQQSVIKDTGLKTEWCYNVAGAHRFNTYELATAAIEHADAEIPGFLYAIEKIFVRSK